MAQQFSRSVVQRLPEACQNDTTPPTFGGIQTLTQQPNGSLLATWSAGSDLAGPLSYEVYILQGIASAAALFSTANIALITRQLSARVFTLSNLNSYLLPGQTYTVGVRAIDALSNRSSNTQLLTAVSLGVLPDALVTISAQLQAILAGVTRSCELESKLETTELKSELEATEVTSIVEVEPKVGC